MAPGIFTALSLIFRSNFHDSEGKLTVKLFSGCSRTFGRNFYGYWEKISPQFLQKQTTSENLEFPCQNGACIFLAKNDESLDHSQ